MRLLDLGCDPFNFSDAMLGVLAMRLCKRICPHCREAYEPTRDEYEELVHAFGIEKLGAQPPACRRRHLVSWAWM